MNKKDNGGWMLIVIWLALCWAAFLNPLVGEFAKAAEYHYWPDKTRLIYAILQGLFAMAPVTVAYFNTGYSKYKENSETPEVPQVTEEKKRSTLLGV